jgi:5'-deoxynucleotidase YfbR-like HD superfamily hydrolase
VETRFILHDTEAKEVPDFYKYYSYKVAGGTRVASAYKLVNEIVEKESLARDYNIYVFHGTDGDDWDTDGKDALSELEKMLEYVARIGITIAEHSYSTTVISMILSDLEGLNTEKIVKMALLHDLAESIIGDIIPDNIAKNEKVRKENIAMKQILKNLPNKIAEPYFEIWIEYQKNSSQESRLLHDIDKLEMAFQAKFYQNKGISKEKLQTFFNTAKKEIKSKNLRNILSNFME